MWPIEGFCAFGRMKRSNHETIDIVKTECNGYTLFYELREYDLYERILVWRGTERQQQVRVRAYESDVEHTQGSPIGRGVLVAEQQSTWNKDDGPYCSWEYQLKTLTERVKAQLEERERRKDTFKTAVESATDE